MLHTHRAGTGTSRGATGNLLALLGECTKTAVLSCRFSNYPSAARQLLVDDDEKFIASSICSNARQVSLGCV